MGRFLNGLAGLFVGFILFLILLPFGALGVFASLEGNVQNADWLMYPVGFAFLLMVGSPLYFWVIGPSKDLIKKTIQKIRGSMSTE